MSIKIYVITDPLAIELLQGNNLEGFKEYITEDDTLYFEDPQYFDA